MQYRWYVENGHIFSDEVTVKKAPDFQKGNEFMSRTNIALNVGDKVARHIVDLHNQSLGVCVENTP